MNVTVIKETVKALAQSLQLTTVVPAGLFVFINIYIMLPQLITDFDPESSSILTIAVGLTLMLSYTLYAFNFPLTRLLEGYKLRNIDWIQWLLQKQRDRFENILEKRKVLETELSHFENRLGFKPETNLQKLTKADARYFEYLIGLWATAERELDRHYPSTYHSVLPTRLGNTIAAFEDYPSRYGINSIALWPRIMPVLRETKYIDFVTQEKSVFDFLLNMLFIVVVLGFELVYFNLFLGNIVTAFVIGASSFVTSIVLYNGLIIAARQWGTTVRVAFDLYRHHLHERLELRPTDTFAEEYRQWQDVSRFLLYRQEGIKQDDCFLTQKEVAERRCQKKGSAKPDSVEGGETDANIDKSNLSDRSI
jgi:hypothetical protein